MDETSPVKHFYTKPLSPGKTPRDRVVAHYVRNTNNPHVVVTNPEESETGLQIIDGDGNFAFGHFGSSQTVH